MCRPVPSRSTEPEISISCSRNDVFQRSLRWPVTRLAAQLGTAVERDLERKSDDPTPVQLRRRVPRSPRSRSRLLPNVIEVEAKKRVRGPEVRTAIPPPGPSASPPKPLATRIAIMTTSASTTAIPKTRAPSTSHTTGRPADGVRWHVVPFETLAGREVQPWGTLTSAIPAPSASAPAPTPSMSTSPPVKMTSSPSSFEDTKRLFFCFDTKKDVHIHAPETGVDIMLDPTKDGTSAFGTIADDIAALQPGFLGDGLVPDQPVYSARPVSSAGTFCRR